MQMQTEVNCNSTVLSWDEAEKLIGKKIMIELSPTGTKRIGYVIDVYNENKPFIVLEIGFKKYEDRKLSKIKSYKVL